MKKKILVVFGTRPEATKMCPLVKRLKEDDDFETTLIVTGQHKEQLYHALDAFGVVPDLDLEIMKQQQSLVYITDSTMNSIDEFLTKTPMDAVVVHGDTQTTVGCALAAVYNKVPLVHIESGLRSGNKMDPWPEEHNRCLVDSISDFLVVPTEYNVSNLIKEGYSRDKIFISGQTQVDGVLEMLKYAQQHEFLEDKLNAIDFSKRVVLLTAHRRENYGTRMENIFDAVREIVERNPDIQVVYPAHLSVYVQNLAKEKLSGHPRIHLMAPINYLDMIKLMDKASFVMSDSGGLQEECPAVNKPLLLLRETTERQEGIEAGTAILVGTDKENIVNYAEKLMSDDELYKRMSEAENPFGDGRASDRIVSYLKYVLDISDEKPNEFRG